MQLIPMDVQHPEMDCDFYYFKPGGKWKYHGEGMFPSHELLGLPENKWYDINHASINKVNNGMPGISYDGQDLVLVVVPRGNCKAKYAYPRMIQPCKEGRGPYY